MIQLYNEDCLEILKTIKDKSIDLIVIYIIVLIV